MTNQSVNIVEEFIDKGTEYKVLGNLSYGNVAATHVPQKCPPRYAKLRPGERLRYRGAGILPVCRIDNEVRILCFQEQPGKEDDPSQVDSRLQDFGGPKNDPTELPARCACRHFAEQTYGIFAVDAPWEKDDVLQGVAEMYYPKVKPGENEESVSEMRELMLKCCRDWAHRQLLADTEITNFYHDGQGYHFYLLPVPYITPDVLDAVSEAVDGGSKWFRWLEPAEFTMRGDGDRGGWPRAQRLHVAAFAHHLEKMMNDPSGITQMRDLIKPPCAFDCNGQIKEATAEAEEEEEAKEEEEGDENEQNEDQEVEGDGVEAEEEEEAPAEDDE